MYRDRLEQTPASGENAEALKQALLAYHDFQRQEIPADTQAKLDELTSWQSKRLTETHADLYYDPKYQTGLAFLFNELYAAQDFSARDRDLERIFPKLVKWLPDKVLATISTLVELNLVTQELDLQLSNALMSLHPSEVINQANYVAAYAYCANRDARLRQLELTRSAALLLEKHAHSAMVKYALKLAQTPAEMAGLQALYDFLKRGFEAFASMEEIGPLMSTLMEREGIIMDKMFARNTDPFNWSP